MKQFNSQVIANYYLAEGFYEMKFLWNPAAGTPLPGQFFTVRASGHTDPLLRRPFAFAGFLPETGSASMIYQVRGKASQLLSRKQPDEELDLAGPFGNSFPAPGDNKLNLVTAGGIGLGPMLYLASWLRTQNHPVKFIFGCRNIDFIPGHKGFNSLQPVICTDDGSEGFEGTTVDFLQTLPPGELQNARLYACGPFAMLSQCHSFAASHNLECFVAMEEIMACGVGACNGCVVKTTSPPGYARVCSEGAVFSSREIVWD